MHKGSIMGTIEEVVERVMLSVSSCLMNGWNQIVIHEMFSLQYAFLTT